MSGIPVFGPTQLAARLETSKAFAKSFMESTRLPTARWGSFKEVESAMKFIADSSFKGLVVKASGLAAGKGVVVTDSK